jgi:hypothetical protein
MHSILPLTLQKVSAHRGIIESAAFSRVKNVFWGTFEILPGNVHVGTSKTASIFHFVALFYNVVHFCLMPYSWVHLFSFEALL